MSLEQRDQFLIEAHLFVVFLLVVDVFHHLRPRRLAHRERCISRLPSQAVQFGPILVKPLREIRLNDANCVANVRGGLEFQKQMAMVSRSFSEIGSFSIARLPLVPKTQ